MNASRPLMSRCRHTNDELCSVPTPQSTRTAPNSLGSPRRQILTSVVAATSDAAKKLDTGPEHVPALSQRSSGRSGGEYYFAPCRECEWAGSKRRRVLTTARQLEEPACQRNMTSKPAKHSNN